MSLNTAKETSRGFSENLPEPRPYSAWRKFKNVLGNILSNPYNLLVIASIIMLFYFIVMPLIEMISTTFKLNKIDVRRMGEGAKAGQFTFYYWKQILFSDISKKTLYEPLFHSLTIAVFTSLFGVSLGAAMAWLIIRTDLPFKRFFSLAVIIPYMLPSWTKAMAWITIFKNERIGGTQGFLNFLGIETPNWLAYGPIAIIAVLTIHYYAYSYLLVSAALQSVSSELEEMGEILGASKPRILRNITFPLILPAILSSIILTFSKSMGTFGVPAFLGLKVNYHTISTMLNYSIKNRQTSLGLAISLVLIVISSINIFINQQLIGRRKSFATIGGKGSYTSLMRLGKWKGPIVILILIFISFAVFLPIFILLYQSLMLKVGEYGLSNLTLHYWIGKANPLIYDGLPGIFRNPKFWHYVSNTLKLVIITSFIATIFGQLIGYINSRGRNQLSSRIVEQLVFVPYLIPSIAFGAMYLSMFAASTKLRLFGYNITLIPSLYGTFTLLILVSIVKHLPFASRAGTSNMMQIATELEEAGQVSGAGFFKRFMKIVFPLSKNGFISGFMLIFISIMKELDLIVLLMTPDQTTLPYMAFTYSEDSVVQLSNAVVIVMFLIVFLIYWIANRFFNADVASGLGG